MEILVFFVVLILSAIFHEVAHGVVAYSLGDPTAKNAGRLTLNPIPHVDPIGSILLPGLLFIAGGLILGWAKPVPVNPGNLKNRRTGEIAVSLAGPGSNILIALAFGLALRLLPVDQWNPSLALVFGIIVYVNILLAALNLLPIPPLDGSHVILSFLPDNLKMSIERSLVPFGFVLVLLALLFLSGYLFLIIINAFLWLVPDAGLLSTILHSISPRN